MSEETDRLGRISILCRGLNLIGPEVNYLVLVLAPCRTQYLSFFLSFFPLFFFFDFSKHTRFGCLSQAVLEFTL